MSRRTQYVLVAVVTSLLVAAAWGGGRLVWDAVRRLHGAH